MKEGVAASRHGRAPSMRADYTRDLEKCGGRPSTSALSLPPMAACSGLTHHFLATMELAEELLHRSRQSIVVQTINYVLTLALVDDQVRLLEDRQVAGDGGLGKIEVP